MICNQLELPFNDIFDIFCLSLFFSPLSIPASFTSTEGIPWKHFLMVILFLSFAASIWLQSIFQHLLVFCVETVGRALYKFSKFQILFVNLIDLDIGTRFNKHGQNGPICSHLKRCQFFTIFVSYNLCTIKCTGTNYRV